MKRILFFALVLASMFAISSCSSEDMIPEENTEQASAPFDKKAEAREAGKRLLESFGMTRSHLLSDSEYPDFYGGGYINNDGKLVVYIKEDIFNGSNTITRAIEDDAIIYVKGNYSYKELKNILSSITSFIESNQESPIANNIKCYYLNDFENNVVVELENCTEADIEAFKAEVVHFSGIMFKKCTREYLPHALSPGDGLQYATMGYRATRYGTQGIVTAGHAYSTGQTVYSRYGEMIGYCDYSIMQGSLDVAFIVVTNFSYPYNNGNLTGQESYIWAGDDVTKLGMVIAQSSGYISNTSLNVNASGVLLNDMAEATYLSAPGDSGGPVYLTGSRKIVGIHNGSGSFTAYFCKVSNISSQLGINYY